MSGVILKAPSHPFRRDGNNDFTSKEGVALVMDSVAQVLGTREGALPWRPTFGSKLHRLLHASSSAIEFVAQYYVVQALERWLPAIRLTRFVALFRDGALHLNIDYRIERNGTTTDTVAGQSISIQP